MSAPTEPTGRSVEAALIEVATAGWRLCRVFLRAMSRLEPAEAARYHSQLRFYEKSVEGALEAANLRLVNLEEQPYEEGLPVTALNLEEFAAGEPLTVDQMIEPIIMGPDGVRRPGVIVLRRSAS